MNNEMNQDSGASISVLNFMRLRTWNKELCHSSIVCSVSVLLNNRKDHSVVSYHVLADIVGQILGRFICRKPMNLVSQQSLTQSYFEISPSLGLASTWMTNHLGVLSAAGKRRDLNSLPVHL